MDAIFRPDNELRKKKCQDLNQTLSSKVTNLKLTLMMDYQQISQESYEKMQKSIDELKKMKLSIEQMSGAIKGILKAAFFLILISAAAIGAIVFGPVGAVVGALFVGIALGAAAGIAYLIVEGLAVH
jgi:ABC-type transport system involved in cytochrome bd biosynthesis fused ATPase/permease subunit